MKWFITILVSLMISYSCSDSEGDIKNEIVPIKKESEGESVWVIESPLKKWIPTYDSLFSTDKNNFIFLKETHDDTCFLIYIKQQDPITRGMCYLLLPQLHRGFEDYQDKRHELLFFEGFSFKLGASEWSNIENFTTKTLQQMNDSVNNRSLCLHCPYYKMIFKGSQRETGNSQLQDEFAKYEAFIRNNIVNGFLKQKKSKPH